VTAPEGVLTFPVDIPDFHAARGIAQLRAAAHVLWSTGVRSRLSAALAAFAPDVVHLHLYAHQLSPSIVGLLRSRRVPTIVTAHDFKLICPAYLAVRDGRDCVACARHVSPLALRYRCLQGSLAWSATAVAEAAMVRTAGLVPDTVVAPSGYMAAALQASWLADGRSIRLLRNPAEPTGALWHGRDGHLLYVGRLSTEKGVDDLVRWSAQLGLRLVVAGDGPQRPALERLAAGTDADVTFLGHVRGEELLAPRLGALAQVVPSTWPENAPLAALEAAVDGIPLVVSDRGGLPEIVDLGARAGVLRTRSVEGLGAALRDLASASGDLVALRSALSMSTHVTALVALYREIVASHGE
jgi:glycosyltransferase involved in cell wall biosynthesis